MEKEYATVRFVENNDFSEIPSIWLHNTNVLEGKITCKWPPPIVKNAHNLMKNKSIPGKNWPIHEIEILRYCDTLEKARKAAEDADYTSSEETSLGRGHRLKRPSATALAAKHKNKRSRTESESSDGEIYRTKQQPLATKPPAFFADNSDLHQNKILQQSINNTNHRQNASEDEDESPNSTITIMNSTNHNMSEEELNDDNNYDACKTQIRDVADRHKVLIDAAAALVSKKTPKEAGAPIEDDNVHYQLLLEILNNTGTLLNLLGKVLVEMKDLKQRFTTYDSSNDCTSAKSTILDKIKKYLPLESRETVAEFELFLSKSDENHRGFLQIIHQVGGTNGEDYAKRVLDLLFSPLFAQKNTWEGKKTKYSVKSLTLIAIVEEVILKKFPSWNSADFGKTGLNWFRLGNQRSGNQPGQLQKKNNVEAVAVAATDKSK